MIDIKDLNIINFSDGHKHLKVTNSNEFIDEEWISISIKSFDDLFLLAQIKSIFPNLKYLVIKYLLGARCDRKFSQYEALDLKIITNFINNLKFEKVEIVKPHSDISLALIDNSFSIIYTKELVSLCLKDIGNIPFSYISPDVGASKWIEKELNITNTIQCNKHRNLDNGKLESISFSDNIQENCIIIDDLCDGGATFTELAKELRKKGAKKVYLIITHGIFSKGFRVFDDLIDHIYCTNSFTNFEDKLLTQIKI